MLKQTTEYARKLQFAYRFVIDSEIGFCVCDQITITGQLIGHSDNQSVNLVISANFGDMYITSLRITSFFLRYAELSTLFGGQVDTRLPGRVRRQAGGFHHGRRRVVSSPAVDHYSTGHVQGQQRRVAAA